MRRHALFLGILALAAVSRFVVLFASQTHVHSDEAIIGLMARHIEQGRYFPFYMYGQVYNAAAAWEAYLSAAIFSAFGDGVIALKSGIVLLSLACLGVFYVTVSRMYDRPTATLAALALAVSPSLFKWHFQVRGYSWYFLSLPVLLGLFWSVDSRPAPKSSRVLLLGLASGISIWGLELVLAPVAALWALLAVRRRLSLKEAGLGLFGALAAYAPAIAFNCLHQFSNWREVFFEKTGGNAAALLRPSTMSEILFEEMPKFFGPDTVLWYYPEKPVSGYVFYAIAVAAVALAAFPVFKSPANVRRALGGASGDEDKDLLMLILVLACLVPYLVAPVRVPGYFLGGVVFLSVLIGRLLLRGLKSARIAPRIAGVIGLAAMLLVGVWVVIDVARRNEIETLTLNSAGKLQMTRIPGADLQGVERLLQKDDVRSVWTSMSFVYPLLFESHEQLAVSDALFGTDRRVYPEALARSLPRRDQRTAFVVETDSPNRQAIEAAFGQTGRGLQPTVSQSGKLTVIEPRSPSP
jgi:hypothetical protein